MKTRNARVALRRATLSFALLAISTFASSRVLADDFDVARLMQLLAASPSMEVRYTEKKFSSLLTEPVVSSGTLIYRRPDTIEKNMSVPRREHFRIAGEALFISRNNSETRISLSSQPLLAAFAASLRGVLTGDSTLLRDHYRLSLEGGEHAWQLTLIPLDQGIGRYVESILILGDGGRVGQIEVREPNGDRSVTQVR